jgi:cation diffusion facilitator family transporter
MAGEPQRIPGLLAIWVSIISIAGKLILTLLLQRTGKNVDSPMLIANARNMRNDILISLGVLIGLFFTITFDQALIDRAIALFISIFIIYSAIRIFMKTNIDLMDGIDDPEVYSRLFEAVSKVKGASNPHRVRARKIGIYYMVNLDIEVEPSLPVKEAHLIAKNVEKSIKSNIRNVYDVMVHIEPLGNLEADERFGITEKDVRKTFRKRK